MKKIALLTAIMALFATNAFANSNACSKRTSGTLFSDTTSSGSSSTKTTNTKGTK